MKVMLVDDSNLARMILKSALGEEFTIVEASNGDRALELYPLEKPDLVILDLLMPGIGGLDVLVRLKELDPTAKVLIGSADIQDSTRQEAERLGALVYIKKPYHSDEIKKLVKGLLA